MQRTAKEYTFHVLLSLDRVVCEIVQFIGNLANISAIGCAAKGFETFTAKGKEFAKRGFLSRLGSYFDFEDKTKGEDLAKSFCCNLLSKFDHCFTGAEVLATICDAKWNSNTITILIQSDSYSGFLEPLYTWYNSNGIPHFEGTILTRKRHLKMSAKHLRRWFLDLPRPLYCQVDNESVGKPLVQKTIRFYFTRKTAGAHSPKAFAENCADFTFLTNWMILNDRGHLEYGIANGNHVMNGVGRYTDYFKSTWKDQWVEWARLEDSDRAEELVEESFVYHSGRRLRYRQRGFLCFGEIPNPCFFPEDGEDVPFLIPFDTYYFDLNPGWRDDVWEMDPLDSWQEVDVGV